MSLEVPVSKAGLTQNGDEACRLLQGHDAPQNEEVPLLGIRLPAFTACDASYTPDTAGYEAAAREVMRRFPRCRTCVFALRNVLTANHHTISGTLFTDGKLLMKLS